MACVCYCSYLLATDCGVVMLHSNTIKSKNTKHKHKPYKAISKNNHIHSRYDWWKDDWGEKGEGEGRGRGTAQLPPSLTLGLWYNWWERGWNEGGKKDWRHFFFKTTPLLPDHTWLQSLNHLSIMTFIFDLTSTPCGLFYHSREPWSYLPHIVHGAMHITAGWFRGQVITNPGLNPSLPIRQWNMDVWWKWGAARQTIDQIKNTQN